MGHLPREEDGDSGAVGKPTRAGDRGGVRPVRVTAAASAGRTSSGRFPDPRIVAMAPMRHRGMSYPAIGKALNRDHSTAHHGVATVEDRAELREAMMVVHEEMIEAETEPAGWNREGYVGS